MTPGEALELAIGNGLFVRFNRHLHRRFAAPGSIVAGMPGDVRSMLEQLRPTDVATIRRDVVALYVESTDDHERRLKLRLDATLRCTPSS